MTEMVNPPLVAQQSFSLMDVREVTPTQHRIEYPIFPTEKEFHFLHSKMRRHLFASPRRRRIFLSLQICCN